MKTFLQKIQAIRDKEIGIHHSSEGVDPFGEADALRMKILNELSKPPKCQFCGNLIRWHVDACRTPPTVCTKCGGRNKQRRMEKSKLSGRGDAPRNQQGTGISDSSSN